MKPAPFSFPWKESGYSVIGAAFSVCFFCKGSESPSSRHIALFLLSGLLCVWYALKAVATYWHFVRPLETHKLFHNFQAHHNKPVNDASRCGVDQGVNMSMDYYNIVTDWYEFGWGRSFQLGGAQGFKEESFDERCRRHDYMFAHMADIRKGEKWLDIGCGVGGPMLNIARFTQAQITGVNLCKYQLDRAALHIAKEGLGDFVSTCHCNMLDVGKQFAHNSRDGIYALEAVCHAPDKLNVYKGFWDVIKPGNYFACVEWVMLDSYDPQNAEHTQCKKAIEVLGGVASLKTVKETIKYMEEAGFVVEEQYDLSNQKVQFPEPWYQKFEPGFTPLKWPITPFGVKVLQWILRCSEFFGYVPKGSAEAHRTITAGIPGTLKSGRLGIFSPHYFIKARKPA